MKITFIPQRNDSQLTLSISGETVTINNMDYDLSVIPDGASIHSSATDCEFIFGDMSRNNGELEIMVILPHGADPHRAIAFPDAVTMVDGVVIDTVNGVYPWSLA